jgi:60 kDa SS-A/Ro ribonucleoprotein
MARTKRKGLISSHISVADTPQTSPIPGKEMIKNRAGGYVFQINDWSRLHRFLILGSEGGTYYASERSMTIENADCVIRCIKEDGKRTVDEIVAVSRGGRAPKNDPALLALALCTVHGDNDTRQRAYAVLPAVARIGTHLYHFAQFMKDLGHGWGRGYRNAIQNWYKGHKGLALQAMKYKQRDGWSHRDLLRLSHTKPEDELQNAIFHYMVTGELSASLPENIKEAELLNARAADIKDVEAAKIIVDHRLPWEVVPTNLRKWLWCVISER